MLAQMTLSDAVHVGWNMRQSDVEEVWAFAMQTPVEASISSYRHSKLYRKTFWWDGGPVAIMGLATSKSNQEIGIPWLLATPGLEACRLPFGKICRGCIAEMKKIRRVMVNYVDAKNQGSIDWLKWLGFSTGEEIFVRGRAFRRFYLCAM